MLLLVHCQLCHDDSEVLLVLIKDLKRKIQCMLFFRERELQMCILYQPKLCRDDKENTIKPHVNEISASSPQILSPPCQFCEDLPALYLLFDFTVVLRCHQMLNKYTTALKQCPNLILVTSYHYCVCSGWCAIGHEWSSEDSSVELGLSVSLNFGSRAETRLSGL